MLGAVESALTVVVTETELFARLESPKLPLAVAVAVWVSDCPPAAESSVPETVNVATALEARLSEADTLFPVPELVAPPPLML